MRLAIFLFAFAFGLTTANVQAAQKAFDSPVDAVKALLDAISAESLDRLGEIIGQEFLEQIPEAERQDREKRLETARSLRRERIVLRFEDPEQTRAVVLVGPDNIELSIPLMKTAMGWQFDSEAGVAELIRRRIVENEDRALESLLEFSRAQARYIGRDWDGDGVLEYAQKIRSTSGRRDGLYWRDDIAGRARTILNEAFADAEYLPNPDLVDASSGYGFKVLTAQGAGALGGNVNYLAEGKLIFGYAIVAFPVEPGVSGEATFMTNHTGIVYEADLGDETLSRVKRMEAFDPDENWKLAINPAIN